jgi:pimeloyl-ACP methyl ester carboxylesterase
MMRACQPIADALAVMDATGTERAMLVALSLGATWALELGALHPERAAELATRLRCPVLVIHGDQDAIRPLANGSCATSSGGAAHDRHTETARADARPLSRRRGLRRARRRSGLLRGLRRRADDVPAFPDVADLALEAVEGADPYLSRHFRVITFDPRGNGRSDRPDAAEAYSYWEFMEDGRAILKATRTEAALFAGICDGGGWALMLAATQPAMALGVVAIAPCVPRLTPSHPNYRRYPSLEPLDTDEGWAKWNVHYWRRDYRGFLEFFFSEQFPEPHSTKHIEDCVQWGLDGSAEALVVSDEEAPLPFASEEEARALCRRIRCPVLVVHGELDGCQPRERAVAVAELAGGTLVVLEGAGHLPQARHPVKVNRLLREFAASVVPPKPK